MIQRIVPLSAFNMLWAESEKPFLEMECILCGTVAPEMSKDSSALLPDVVSDQECRTA
jgi:hypothetical protein